MPPKARVTEGGKPLERAPGVNKIARTKDAVTCQLAAGRYRFAAEWTATKKLAALLQRGMPGSERPVS